MKAGFGWLVGHAGGPGRSLVVVMHVRQRQRPGVASPTVALPSLIRRLIHVVCFQDGPHPSAGFLVAVGVVVLSRLTEDWRRNPRSAADHDWRVIARLLCEF